MTQQKRLHSCVVLVKNIIADGRIILLVNVMKWTIDTDIIYVVAYVNISHCLVTYCAWIMYQ